MLWTESLAESRAASRMTSKWRAAEGRTAGERSDQSNNAPISQLLFERVQLPAALEYGDHVGLEFGLSLQPGAGQLRHAIGDDRRLRLRSGQVACQHCGVISRARRLQCLIRSVRQRVTII